MPVLSQTLQPPKEQSGDNSVNNNQKAHSYKRRTLPEKKNDRDAQRHPSQKAKGGDAQCSEHRLEEPLPLFLKFEQEKFDSVFANVENAKGRPLRGVRDAGDEAGWVNSVQSRPFSRIPRRMPTPNPAAIAS